MSYQAAFNGLGLLIQDALAVAQQSGRADIVSRLEEALTASSGREKPRFELDILAGQVRKDGVTIALPRGERALLTILAILRRACTRDELVDLLYPHLDAHTGAIQLKVYVHRVRRRLGDAQTIVFAAERYRLGDVVAVDFWAVEADVARAVREKGGLAPEARARLERIRERLLRRDPACAPDNDWCSALERRLTDLRFDVTICLGEAALASQDCAAASRLASEIFELDPCDERGAALAIRSALCNGDRALALRQFRRYERVLKGEFDASPSPELAALLGTT